MPKAKVAKKVEKKSVKKSIVAKSAPRVAKPVTKKRSLFFRLTIAAALIFLAGSLYQAFAFGTGIFSSFTSTPDINYTAPMISCAEFTADESGCKSKGCNWTPGKVEESTKTYDCQPGDCGYKKECKEVISTKTGQAAGCYFGSSKSSITTSALCKVEGGSWSNGTTTTVRTCTGQYKITKTNTTEGSCSGNPVVYQPPVVIAPPVAVVNPPAVVTTTPGKLCCAPEISSSSCPGNNTGFKGTKYTITKIAKAGESCASNETGCPPTVDIATAKVGTFVCAYGTKGPGLAMPNAGLSMSRYDCGQKSGYFVPSTKRVNGQLSAKSNAKCKTGEKNIGYVFEAGNGAGGSLAPSYVGACCQMPNVPCIGATVTINGSFTGTILGQSVTTETYQMTIPVSDFYCKTPKDKKCLDKITGDVKSTNGKKITATSTSCWGTKGICCPR